MTRGTDGHQKSYAPPPTWRFQGMYRCTRPGCGWQSIAPSEDAAFDQYVEHLIGEHAECVEATIPEGMVQVRFGEREEWVTVTPEEAKRLHRDHHDDG